jgi:hypothetical protein
MENRVVIFRDYGLGRTEMAVTIKEYHIGYSFSTVIVVT